MPAGRGYTLMVHREGALQSRQVRVSAWAARLAIGLAITIVIAAILAVVFYGPTARAAARSPFLEREVARLKEENGRVLELARRLDEVESRYAQLRGMLGASVTLPSTTPAAGEGKAGEEKLYVAPPIVAGAPAPADSATATGPSVPRRWPLSVGSYRTRGLAVGDPGLEAHSGIDLAVPVGSDVRATGGGQVTETGTDPAYGFYIRINHGSGYQSMYGHLSRIIVARGDAVRAGQVIGLSGNTGRSTAPHLHFEILRAGRSVDPLSLVREGT
jgi:murein DD-endopeptidase MepM/ murein hydrolase activator NlpD